MGTGRATAIFDLFHSAEVRLEGTFVDQDSSDSKGDLHGIEL